MRRYVREHLVVKVFLMTAILLLTLSAVIYGMVGFGMSTNYLAELNRSLEKEIHILITEMRKIPESEMANMIENFAIEHGLSIDLKDKNGNELASLGNLSYSVAPGVEKSKAQVSLGLAKTFVVESGEGNQFQMIVFGTKEQANIPLDTLAKVFPILAVITFSVAILFAVFFTRYITRPILKVNEASKRMVDLDFKKPYPETRSDEIGMLGENLNRLAERLEDTLNELKGKNAILLKEIEKEQKMECQQAAFFSAISHDLKTPVTILKGQLQGMIYNVGGYKNRDKYLRRSFEVALSLEEMIQEILDIAKMKSMDFSLNISEMRLDQMVEDILRSWEDIATDKALKLHVRIDGEFWVKIDKVLFIKVVRNLIGNAVKYTPENGNIWVKIYEASGNIIFAVENNSERIPDEEIAKLFDPFYRRELSRNRKAGGNGLGLYIVKMVADLHQFQYRFRNTREGVEIQIICTNK